MVWATLDLVMHILGALHPIHAVLRLFIGVAMWLAQVGFWIDCDLVKSRESAAPTQLCYQSYAKHDAAGNLVGVPASLANASVAVGILVLLV